MEQAVVYPGIELLPLTPQIAIESTKLPGNFHHDPADQIIVATARVYNLTILTVDRLILDYPHVRTL
jgi:PIN domain nuclease of toxin-antitoxin system